MAWKVSAVNACRITKIKVIISYVPYKYDTAKFVYVGSISRDHIDPSIFCVLTAESKKPGIPLADFLIFGERWDVASNTFRPPVSIVCGCSLIWSDYSEVLPPERC